MDFELSPQAEEDFAYFSKNTPKVAKRILTIIQATCSQPFSGVGKPEPLRYSLTGWWSRRITREHRMVYQVRSDVLYIIQLRFHY